MDKVELTVLMPVYKCKREWLKEAIESILIQTYKNFEFIIIEDGCDEDTSKIINYYAKRDNRIKIIKNMVNLGIVLSLNKGIEMSKAQWIARMDADDVANPIRFEKQMAYLQEHPETAVLGTFCQYFETGKSAPFKLIPISDKEIKSMLPFVCSIIHPSVIFNKRKVKHLGGYPQYRYAEDYALWMSLLFANESFHNIPEYLLLYRKGEERIDYKKVQQNTFNLILQKNFEMLNVPYPKALRGQEVTSQEVQASIESIKAYANALMNRFPVDELFLLRSLYRMKLSIYSRQSKITKKYLIHSSYNRFCYFFINLAIFFKRFIKVG